MNFSEVKYETTLGTEPVTIEINSDSPVFAFDSGKAFFGALALHSDVPGKSLELRTFFYGLTAIDAHFLYPAITFIDRHHQPIATAYPQNLKYDSYTWQKKATWVGMVAVPATAKYALVHTPRDKIDTKYSGPAYAVGSTYMIGRTVLTMPGGNITAVATFGGTGKLTITAK